MVGFMVQVSCFVFHGPGLRVQGSGVWLFRQTQGSGFRVQGQGSGFRVQGSGFIIQGCGLMVEGVCLGRKHPGVLERDSRFMRFRTHFRAEGSAPTR
jgi:hypothetical protein